MNNGIEELPLSVRLLSQCLGQGPIRDILTSFLTESQILSFRLVNSQWSHYFNIPQFKIQPPLPSEPHPQRQCLVEKFNGNIYGSGSGSSSGSDDSFSIGDFVGRIPHGNCKISILINTFNFSSRLTHFIADNQPINRFITHLTLWRCYAYETNPNSNRNCNRNANQDSRTPLLTLDQFYTLIFEQLQNLEYLAIDRIPHSWTGAKLCQLIQRTRENRQNSRSRSRSSLRTLVFAHGWLNMGNKSFLAKFLSLFPNVEKIWGMSLKCCESVEFSGKTRMIKSMILEESTRAPNFLSVIKKFTVWAKPRFGVQLEELKFNLSFWWRDQRCSWTKSELCRQFSAILNHHQNSLKTLLLQPLVFWFPALFNPFPVFRQVTTLKFNGKHIFTEIYANNKTEPKTIQVNEKSYAFLPADFNLALHFPNLTAVKISFYFPNHSRTTGTLLNYCLPLRESLIHKGVEKLELVDLAGLMNFHVIQRFAFLFPNVTSLTLKKNLRDPDFESALSAIWTFWPKLEELQCKMVYKTGNGRNFGLRNWDSAVSGFSEEICEGLRRNPDQGYQEKMEARRLNSSISNMTELKRFTLVFTTDSASAELELKAAVKKEYWPGFLSCVSWDYGFKQLGQLELIVIFGKFCRGFRDIWVLGPMLASTSTKVVDETPP